MGHIGCKTLKKYKEAATGQFQVGKTEEETTMGLISNSKKLGFGGWMQLSS